MYHGEMDVIQWTWFFFHITSGRINTWKGVKSVERTIFLNLIIFLKTYIRNWPIIGIFMIKNPLFITIHNKNVALLQNFKFTWPYPESDQLTGNPLFIMTTSQRACKPVMTTRAFSRRNQHRTKAMCWKSGGRKKVLAMLGYHSIQQMLSI